MASLFIHNPISPLSPLPNTTRPTNPLLLHLHRHTQTHKPLLRGSVCVARYHADPQAVDFIFRDLIGRSEGLLYTLADAAVASSEAAETTAKQSGDWLSGITSGMESVLKFLKGGLSAVHVPYAYGFAIILLTVIVKAATFPLTKKQVESAMAMRSLQPQIKAIQQRYAGNQERIQLETARLYKLAGINPLAGCLPTLATIPVWIGLYRALSNVADEGLLTEGFFWIPSLAGPTTVAARQSGSGISWLFPFVDGQPPLGWHNTLAYLVLPVLLVAAQYISVEIMQSSQPQSNDPNTKNTQVLTKVLPLMIGYFALSVPSGLSLYWLTNNILSTAQQVWLQKLGGARNPFNHMSYSDRNNPSDQITDDTQPQIPKSLFEAKSTVREARQEAKLASKGPRPGERFKQLKEQEERKRQEEEKIKAKAKANQITEDAGPIHDTSNRVANSSDLPAKDSNDDQNLKPILEVENAEALENREGVNSKNDEQQPHENSKLL